MKGINLMLVVLCSATPLAAHPQVRPALLPADPAPAAVVVAAVKPALPPRCTYRVDAGLDLPDPACTPGAVDPEVVADPSGDHRVVDGVEMNICAKGFTTRPFRRTTEAMKHTVCAEYGAADCPDPKKGEVDHLVPLELGGRDALANLWWQPAPAYHVKDRQVEDKLKPLVCAGRLTLRQAQDCVRGDWVACAAKVKVMEAK